ATTKIYTIASGLIAGLYTPFELMLNTIRKTKIFMAKHLPFKPSSIYSYGFEDDNKPTKKKVQRLRFSAPPHNENDTSTSVGSGTSVPHSSVNAVDLDPQPASESKDNNPTLTEKSDLQHPPAPSNSEPVMNAVDDDSVIKLEPLSGAVGSDPQPPTPSNSEPVMTTGDDDSVIKLKPLSEAVESNRQHPPAPSNSEPVMNAVDDHNIIKQQPLPKAPGTYSASTHLDKDPVNSKTVDAESSILRRRRPDPTSPSVENATMDRHTTSVVENTHLGLNFFEIPCETSIRQIIRQFVL
ncbi:MAG: hypothetical protein VYC40_04945, partial [Pseudomonadota bacterium]|nr:hypothetical protein [Pseudomonadota bacterium]